MTLAIAFCILYDKLLSFLLRNMLKNKNIYLGKLKPNLLKLKKN